MSSIRADQHPYQRRSQRLDRAKSAEHGRPAAHTRTETVGAETRGRSARSGDAGYILGLVSAHGSLSFLFCVALVVLCLLFLGAHRGRPREWTDDPDINGPISNWDPRGVRIVSAPFPVAELVSVAESYAAAARHIKDPQSVSNISLRLEAPGIRRVDLRSWILNLPRDPTFRKITGVNETSPRLLRLAENPAALIAETNISLTISMIESLWRRLVDEGLAVLALGLGENHPEYAALTGPLASPPIPVSSSLNSAAALWTSLQREAYVWPAQSLAWLQKMAWRLDGWGIGPVAGKDQELQPLPRLGRRAPTLSELLEYDRARPAFAGRSRTLPQLLDGLQLSRNATSLLGRFHISPALGINGLSGTICTDPGLLDAVARGRCDDNLTAVIEKPLGYRNLAAALKSDRLTLEGLRDALSAFSRLDSLASHFRDGLARRMGKLERAIDAFHPLYSSLKLQRQILAGAARNLQHACFLQESLLERAGSLLSDPSARWKIGRDVDGSRRVVVTFATVPELDDAIAYLKSEYSRILARYRRLRQPWYTASDAISLLHRSISGGWMERLGVQRDISWKTKLSLGPCRDFRPLIRPAFTWSKFYCYLLL
ncbi:uncharacterized protein THITE_160867 [Thermothielavioides terrestris NRRL 8126]|uniref:Uncharacterized protein n=1 Tax=Thermothielavioides terrestris (strain ATCC 38088 / NRRL 8126) TaxID=578455 RepID=G2R5R2_THETT|nr:uncharacterized protein THITE_160867 [Thermothielavioides terrestris NRRL 8126]AEO67501.1 hypothetical protein THITE_160867 [Thermothielavioides terrestris NRRL 8126]